MVVKGFRILTWTQNRCCTNEQGIAHNVAPENGRQKIWDKYRGVGKHYQKELVRKVGQN